jgi:hypothetical protein
MLAEGPPFKVSAAENGLLVEAHFELELWCPTLAMSGKSIMVALHESFGKLLLAYGLAVLRIEFETGNACLERMTLG